LDIREKLRILSDAAKYDASCASSGSKRARGAGGLGNSDGVGICHSYTPDGRCVSLLKILFTNYCVYDCAYCINRISSDTPRARFTPEEVIFLTMEFYRRNYIEGLFLSSGVIQSADYTIEQLIRVARGLREDCLFHGYIHLKTVPGASPDAIALAGRFADRLSANIELPLEADLIQLAPAKSHREVQESMGHIQHQFLDAKDRRESFAPAGQTTQMIVGATESPDAAMLSKASQLYSEFGLRRIYYSAFSPIPHGDPGLPIRTPPLVREHRLYQADWLMRFYGFEAGELTTATEPNLSLKHDPKLAWALRHREMFPLDVNRASKGELLRIPGLGVRNVRRILQIRRYHRITLDDLAQLKVPLSRTRPFIITEDAFSMNGNATIDQLNLPVLVAAPEQLSLFEAAASARTGEL
jgi:putative DNA modification/repair radical SAM protein